MNHHKLIPGNVYWRHIRKFVYLGSCCVVTEDGDFEAHVAVDVDSMVARKGSGGDVRTSAHAENLLLGNWTGETIQLKKTINIGGKVYKPLRTPARQKKLSHQAETLVTLADTMHYETGMQDKVYAAVHAMPRRSVTAAQAEKVLTALINPPFTIMHAAEVGDVSSYTARQIANTALATAGL